MLAARFLAAGAAIAAPPAAGSCYEGNMPLPSGDIAISLCLYDQSFFVLAQKQKSKGKKRSLDICGKWRLADNDSILRLANANGYVQIFNVGGKGKLYGDFFAGQSALPRSVILKPAAFSKLTFGGSGAMTMRGKKLSLKEAASGKIFEADAASVQNFSETWEKKRKLLEQGLPLFAEAWLSPEYGGGKIIALRHVSEKMPGGHTITKEKNACAESAAAAWIVEIPDIGTALCRFTKNELQEEKSGKRAKKNKTPKKRAANACSGFMEISAAGFRLEGSYQADNSGFSLAMKKNEIARLISIGAGKFAQNLLGVESWEMDDDMLVLKGPNIPDIVLRKYRHDL